jgi:uncharacterized membrane protein
MTSYRRRRGATNGAKEEKPMKRVLAMALTIVLMGVFPAAAEQQDPVGVVAHVLELSEDQITAWVEILHAREVAIQPLAQQAQGRQQQIGQALDSSSPDAAAIGRALIELRALQGQINAANAQSAAQFEQLLTSDQRERLSGIRSAAQVCPVVPAFQATGLIGEAMNH